MRSRSSVACTAARKRTYARPGTVGVACEVGERAHERVDDRAGDGRRSAATGASIARRRSVRSAIRRSSTASTERVLRAVVVVDGRHVRSGLGADGPHRRGVEAAVGDEPLGRLQQALGGGVGSDVDGGHRRQRMSIGRLNQPIHSARPASPSRVSRPGSQDGAGQVAGELAADDRVSAPDEDALDARRLRVEPLTSRREVVPREERLRPDRVGVEHDEVGDRTLARHGRDPSGRRAAPGRRS